MNMLVPIVITASLLASTSLHQGHKSYQPHQAATQPKASKPPKPDKEAMAAVKVHYTYVGCYTYAYQVNIENTDNHRAVAVVIQTPNSKDPFKPYVDRFTVHPRQFQSVRYVMFPNSARVIDAKFVE